jgi:hypothetical protein
MKSTLLKPRKLSDYTKIPFLHNEQIHEEKAHFLEPSSHIPVIANSVWSSFPCFPLRGYTDI